MPASRAAMALVGELVRSVGYDAAIRPAQVSSL